MGYSITQKPQLFSPAYNQIIYVCVSSNHIQPNHQYICQIYDTGSTLIATVMQFPLADGSAFFDIHRILENFVSWDLNPGYDPEFSQNIHSGFGYVCKFGEQYGATLTQSLATVTDTEKYVWNGIFDFPDWPSYNEADWLLATATQKKFLTNAPRVQNIRTGESAWLYWMTNTDVVDHALFIFYDASGADLFSGSPNTNPDSLTWGDGSRFARLAVGTGNLNDHETYITDSVAYYTVQLMDSSGDPVSELFTFKIVCACSKYPTYRLHFLNKMGGFDSFDFNRKSHNAMDIVRQSYQKVIGAESGGHWAYYSSDRVNSQFDIAISPKLSLESDWITDIEAQWLEELVTSPVVFWEKSIGNLIAMNVATTSYEIQQKANDKVITLKLDLTYSYDKTRQRQ